MAGAGSHARLLRRAGDCSSATQRSDIAYMPGSCALGAGNACPAVHHAQQTLPPFAHVQNQLFTLQSDRESAAAGREEEANLAAAEVDAAQRRLAGLEAEKAALVAQVNAQRTPHSPCYQPGRHL